MCVCVEILPTIITRHATDRNGEKRKVRETRLESIKRFTGYTLLTTLRIYTKSTRISYLSENGFVCKPKKNFLSYREFTENGLNFLAFRLNPIGPIFGVLFIARRVGGTPERIYRTIFYRQCEFLNFSLKTRILSRPEIRAFRKTRVVFSPGSFSVSPALG